MIIKYNEEQMLKIVDDIFTLTGISIAILDAKYKNIVSSAKRQKYCLLLQAIEGDNAHCIACDRMILARCASSGKLESHICKAGLYDSAMPIIKHGVIVGFVIMGQVRSDKSPSTPRYVPDTDSKTAQKLEEHYNSMPFISKEKLEALYDLLPRILFDNAIETIYDPLVNDILDYIASNLKENLSVSLLCEKFYISKNRLYNVFKDNLKCTVTEYINRERIKKAKELLKTTKDSACHIAESVGIANYPYFCRLFKKICGKSPSEYKKGM